MNDVAPSPVVLGSQSPRRRELLGRLVGPERLRIVTPRNSDEPDFAGRHTLTEIDARLHSIARLKYDDVTAQLRNEQPGPCVVTADTMIVGLPDGNAPPVVLGKPPESEALLRSTLRQWFADYYAGRRHLAKTAVCVGHPGKVPRHVLVTTEIWFRSDSGQFVDWYCSTGEPLGKAGGYAIQEAGSLFVEQIVGSLSNVVGLPLVETLGLLQQAGAVRGDFDSVS